MYLTTIIINIKRFVANTEKCKKDSLYIYVYQLRGNFNVYSIVLQNNFDKNYEKFKA